MSLTEAQGRVLRCGEGVVATWVCYGGLGSGGAVFMECCGDNGVLWGVADCCDSSRVSPRVYWPQCSRVVVALKVGDGVL